MCVCMNIYKYMYVYVCIINYMKPERPQSPSNPNRATSGPARRGPMQAM